jgi:MFS superfamily sulfate permease-like transporter
VSVGRLPAVAVGVLLTLYSVLREANHPHVVQVIGGVDGTENTLTRREDPLVVRTQLGLYTANLRANSDVVRRLVTSCEPRPRTVVLDLSRQPRVTSTILNGLRDLDTELATLGVRIVYAALREPVRTTARRWPWWAEVEREHRAFATVDAAVQAAGH